MGEIQSLVDRLNARRRLRVWSIIITFFGDAVINRGGAISAKTVQDVLFAMGVEAGTVRTAFSRLTRDSWVEREKIGRASFYRISPTGKAPFEAAAGRIYTPYHRTADADSGKNWLVLEKSNPTKLKFVRGTQKRIKHIYDDEPFIAEATPHTVPSWFRDRFDVLEHREGLEHLIEDFSPLNVQGLSGLDSLVLRCLLIHEWRRLVLQFDPVPDAVKPDGWPEQECHQLVATLFHEVLAQSENWLDTHAVGPKGALPTSKAELNHRFQ